MEWLVQREPLVLPEPQDQQVQLAAREGLEAQALRARLAWTVWTERKAQPALREARGQREPRGQQARRALQVGQALQGHRDSTGLTDSREPPEYRSQALLVALEPLVPQEPRGLQVLTVSMVL